MFFVEPKDKSTMQDSQAQLVLSPERCDPPQASSLEMSPSNSSGGTYMWDEEGFETFEGPGTHPLDTYDDSEVNSLVSMFLAFEPKERCDLITKFYIAQVFVV